MNSLKLAKSSKVYSKKGSANSRLEIQNIESEDCKKYLNEITGGQ